MKEESISLLQLKSVITLDYVYIFCAIYLLIFGILTIVDRKNPKRIGTAVFWIVYAITFYGCDHLAKLTGLAAGEIAGWLVILMAVIVATKQLGKGEYKEAAPATKLAAATHLGNLLFIPVLGVGVLTFFIAWPRITDLGAIIGFSVRSSTRRALAALSPTSSRKSCRPISASPSPPLTASAWPSSP